MENGHSLARRPRNCTPPPGYRSSELDQLPEIKILQACRGCCELRTAWSSSLDRCAEVAVVGHGHRHGDLLGGKVEQTLVRRGHGGWRLGADVGLCVGTGGTYFY